MKNSYCLRTQPDSLDYYGECRPARETAWDFFEFIPVDPQTLVCSLGRIHGRGRSAAFTMASMQAFLRSLTRHHRGNFAGVVRDLNRAVYEIAPDSFYASLFYAWMDTAHAQLHYVSAGHGPVLLIRSGPPHVRRLENTGTVLGLSLRVDFRQRTMGLEPGDLLLAMTDGVTDTLREGEVLEMVDRGDAIRPVDLVRRVLDASRGGDDRTALAVRLQRSAEMPLFELEAAERAASAA
jgi:sigma-B regulation protein RsbU (phosphoserine phosphatase)